MTAGEESGLQPQRIILLLALLWVAFLVRGIWYCALLPPWEGYDEPYHFAALQNVATGQGLPHSDTRITLEVEQSIHLLPLPWELQFQAIPGPLTPHENFWSLAPTIREERLGQVRSMPPENGGLPAVEPILNYESQQAPLYYWLFALPLRWLRGASLLSRIYALRIFNVLIASIVVPCTYRIAQRVFGTSQAALGVTAFLVLLPELMIDLARVGNEGLAVIFYSLLLMGALRVVDHPASWPSWIWLGAALGFGLLTKAYFLTAVPAVAFVGILSVCALSHRGGFEQAAGIVLIRGTAAFALTAAVAASWYAKVHSATGSWSGQVDDAALRNVSLLHKLAATPHVNWRSGILSVLISHTWFGGWSFLRVPIWIYVLAFLIIAAAIIGMIMRFARRAGRPRELRDVAVLSAFYLTFWLGLAYHVLVTFLHTGVSATTGWYLYSTVAAEIVLLVWGLQAFLPTSYVIPGLVMCAATLDLYGTHALLMPYYAGLSAHVGKSVAPALGTTITQIHVTFERSSLMRPAWLGSPRLFGLWIAYWVATLTVVGVVVRMKGRSQGGI